MGADPSDVLPAVGGLEAEKGLFAKMKSIFLT